MARSISNVKVEEKKPEVVKETKKVEIAEQVKKPEVTKVNNERPGNKYLLDITCNCTGRYFPFTHRISADYVDGITYRCNKCGKDINVKLTPAK